MSFHVPEQYRLRGIAHNTPAAGNNGAFLLPNPTKSHLKLRVIASDGEGWEHVSVSVAKAKRVPSWDEMCHVKNVFWDDEDCAMQLHPPESTWVNNHPYTLHLWRPIGKEIPLPHPILVGVQSAGVLPGFGPGG